MKKKKWCSIKEIANALKINESSVSKNLKKMYQFTFKKEERVVKQGKLRRRLLFKIKE